MTSQNYTAESIKVLKGLEAVRVRPGMYIGDTGDGTGLHHMVYEVTDNAMDEHFAGFCSKIQISLNDDGSVTVLDNGRGIPVDYHEEAKMSAAELIMTQLHAGGKFDKDSYHISAGTHGLGVSVVNALSEKLFLDIWRDGYHYAMEFANGNVVKPLEKLEPSSLRGTQVTFKPSSEIFETVDFDFETLSERFRELAFLNKNVTIILRDKSVLPEKEVRYNDENSEECTGLVGFVKFFSQDKQLLFEPISFEKAYESGGGKVAVALSWTDSSMERALYFTNNTKQNEGGTHAAGFKAALTRVVVNYANESGLLKKHKVTITGEDVREGLVCVLSLNIPDPKFASQTKNKLVTPSARTLVEGNVVTALSEFLELHPKIAQILIEKCINSAKIRETTRRAREMIRNKQESDITLLAGKLADCQERSPEKSELYIVEGNSAGGSTKQARDRRTQAVLPLKGKVMNVEKMPFKRLISSVELCSLIAAVGASACESGLKLTQERYHKVIIMTDADVDGSHIRVLLLTFFFRYLPEIIENGHLYIAQPPLYRITKSGKDMYIKNDASLTEYIADSVVKNSSLEIASGAVLREEELRDAIRLAGETASLSKSLPSDAPAEVLEHLAISMSDVTTDGLEINIDSFSEKLNKSFPLYEWYFSKLDTGRYEIKRYKDGLANYYSINEELLYSEKFKQLVAKTENLNWLCNNQCTFKNKDSSFSIGSPGDLIAKVNGIANNGFSLQRFKGLGEMNADQLWDTTLNPETRTLLKVRIEDREAVDEMFIMLMGDIVENRRNFIYENSFKIKSEDIDV